MSCSEMTEGQHAGTNSRCPFKEVGEEDENNGEGKRE